MKEIIAKTNFGAIIPVNEEEGFYVNGTYGDTTYDNEPLEDKVFNLYYGTEIAVSNTDDEFAIHLKNDSSTVHCDLKVSYLLDGMVYLPYAWYLDGVWIVDNADPSIILGVDKHFTQGQELEFLIEFKAPAEMDVSSEDVEGHGYFHRDLFINDPTHTIPAECEDMYELDIEIFEGCELLTFDDGSLHVDYDLNPGLNFANDLDYSSKCQVVTAIPADGYQFSR